MKFENPSSYNLCDSCTQTLQSITGMFDSGDMPDTDDSEAPINFMYDHGIYCGGHECTQNNPPVKYEIWGFPMVYDGREWAHTPRFVRAVKVAETEGIENFQSVIELVNSAMDSVYGHTYQGDWYYLDGCIYPTAVPFMIDAGRNDIAWGLFYQIAP